MDQQQVYGILSNWDKIEADIRVGLHDEYGKSKNLQDVIDIIHELQTTAVTVSPLRELFNKHVTNTKNPHEVEIKISDLDVIEVLYDLYGSKYGSNMSLAEFAETLVRIKRFVTREDVDNQTNLNDVLNADVMEYITERHDLNPDAHAELFRYKLPGTPPVSPPSFTLDPSLGVKGLVSVIRNSTMNYHDINGRIRVAQPNTLAVDYSYGVASVPIFGQKRNILHNSRTLTDVSIHGAVVSENYPFVLTPVDDQEYLLLIETGVDKHGFVDNFTEPLTGTNIYYVYGFSFGRNHMEINLLDGGGQVKATAKYSLTEGTSVVTGSIGKLFSDVQVLPNGWTRASLAFDATDQGITKLEVNALQPTEDDEYGVSEYEGNGQMALGFWQHQLTTGTVPVPPIFTNNGPGTVPGTQIRTSFTSQFNPIRGTFVVKYISPLTELFETHNHILRVGVNDEGGEVISNMLNIRTNPVAPNRSQVVSYNVNNHVITDLSSKGYAPEELTQTKRVIFTYTTGYQGFGFTGEAPIMMRITNDIGIQHAETFFGEIFDQDSNQPGVVILQFEGDDIPFEAFDLDGTLPIDNEMYADDFRVNDAVNFLEIGYSSETDQYLEGYLLNFRYYSVFASKMNIEFLLDQYIPTAE